MTTQNGDGAGVLARDAKWGNLWNSVVAGAIGAVVAALNGLDFSGLPGWAATLGPPAAGLVVGWLTSKGMARVKR